MSDVLDERRIREQEDNVNIVSIGSLVVAALALLISIFNNSKKETREESEEIAKIMTRLDSLADDVREIKDDFRREMAELKASYREDHDRIIKLEMSLDTAWRRIDELRKKSGEG